MFNGSNANGNLAMYVVDDAGLDSGSIGADGGQHHHRRSGVRRLAVHAHAPANITQSNDPGQCGAVVRFSDTQVPGVCGVVVTAPASGSFFPWAAPP